MDKDIQVDLDRLLARLQIRKDQLAQIRKSTAESRRPVELDQASVGRLSRMDALQGQAMALATEGRRAAELRRIDAALARIAEGEFGYCLSCGGEIDPRRLDLDPTTAVCVDCARSAEH
jgi:DnaK suppressor protein